MSIWKGIDRMRRRVMRLLTRRLGKSRTGNGVEAPETIKRILICRTNHRLGNLLLVTPLLAEIEKMLPDAKVDLFVKGNIPLVIFKNFPQVNRIIRLPKKPLKDLFGYLRGWSSIVARRYDVAINVVFNSSSGRISTELVNARFKFLGELAEGTELPRDREHMAKFPVYGFRKFMRQIGVSVGNGSIAPLDIRLTADEIADGKRILDDLVQNGKRTIAVYTFATGAKCYGKEWWDGVYEKLNVRFEDFNIIEVLPIENVSQIDFRAPSFYSKDLRKIAALIHNVEVFIVADSGMMHLASASQTPVIGLFKAQNVSTYAPYNDGSTGVDTRNTTPDDLVEIVASRVQYQRQVGGS